MIVARSIRRSSLTFGSRCRGDAGLAPRWLHRRRGGRGLRDYRNRRTPRRLSGVRGARTIAAMADSPEQPSILLLCRDLMFLSKVTATARAAGVNVQVVRDPTMLPAMGTRLLVDLNQDGALDAAAGWKAATGGEVIGFVSHVDGETIQRARQAGLDQTLPRSRFTADLE